MLTRRTALTAMVAAAVAARTQFAFPASERDGPIALSLNENPFGPSPRALDAIRAELPRAARYNSEAATNGLIDVIAAKERVDRDQVVLGEILEPLGLHLALTGGAGSEFLYSVPGYPALVDAATAVGGKAVTVPLDNSLTNDLDALAAHVNPRTRAVFVVNPHNPSGTVNESPSLKRFLSQAAQRTLVIVDEAYLEFADHFATRTAVDLTRSGGNVLVFRTWRRRTASAGSISATVSRRRRLPRCCAIAVSARRARSIDCQSPRQQRLCRIRRSSRACNAR